MKKTRLISRFRRRSERWIAALFLAVLPFGLAAQQTSAILTIDPERLFSETQAGSETIAAFEREVREIGAENDQIEQTLLAEESDLTERRASLPPDEFRALADAFDARVQKLRAEQDEKVRQLSLRRDDARAQFFNEIGPILSEIVVERGAVAVIDRRDVFLSSDRIDITDEAIARINASRTPKE